MCWAAPGDHRCLGDPPGAVSSGALEGLKCALGRFYTTRYSPVIFFIQKIEKEKDVLKRSCLYLYNNTEFITNLHPKSVVLVAKRKICFVVAIMTCTISLESTVEMD